MQKDNIFKVFFKFKKYDLSVQQIVWLLIRGKSSQFGLLEVLIIGVHLSIFYNGFKCTYNQCLVSEADFWGCTKLIQCKIILMEQLAFVFLNLNV